MEPFNAAAAWHMLLSHRILDSWEWGPRVSLVIRCGISEFNAVSKTIHSLAIPCLIEVDPESSHFSTRDGMVLHIPTKHLCDTFHGLRLQSFLKMSRFERRSAFLIRKLKELYVSQTRFCKRLTKTPLKTENESLSESPNGTFDCARECYECNALASIDFANGCLMSQIGGFMWYSCKLASIIVPRRVEVLRPCSWQGTIWSICIRSGFFLHVIESNALHILKSCCLPQRLELSNGSSRNPIRSLSIGSGSAAFNFVTHDHSSKVALQHWSGIVVLMLLFVSKRIRFPQQLRW
jgi:hypothetical protein